MKVCSVSLESSSPQPVVTVILVRFYIQEDLLPCVLNVPQTLEYHTHTHSQVNSEQQKNREEAQHGPLAQ